MVSSLIVERSKGETSRHPQGKTRLAKVGHSKWLVAWPIQKREVLEASGCVFFHTRKPKKFCQFIKGIKLPDGFGSCFKHKVTDNDTNITGLKSHDCHIMMQRLLPYAHQNYLPDKIAKLIIELCSLFKQICSATLMEDDMLKAQIKVINILCDLELIYPPALFGIMIHLVIHLPLEALEGGPIRPWWMYPFERYMKKLKGYVRNKAKPEDNDKDPEVSTTSELFALACGPTWTLILINSCVVNGVRYVVHSRDERRITQNSGICSPGPDGEMYYDGQSPEVDVPPDIIIDMSSDVARSHGGNGGGEDRPLHTMYPAVVWVALLTEFKLRDKQTVMPPGDHAAHWSSYIEEVIRGVPLYYPSWLKVPKERKAALIKDIGNDPRNIDRAAQNRQNRAKSTVISRQGSRSLARLRDEMRGHITGVGRVLPARATASPSTSVHDSTLNSLHKMVDFMMSIFKNDSKYSDMFSQFESSGASGSGGYGDEEEGADHQEDEDEDGDGDA
nr:hypothetical protein [Tanacetum cinerariifolium]